MNLNSPDRPQAPRVETPAPAPAMPRAPDQLRQPINLGAQKELADMQENLAKEFAAKPEVVAMKQDLETMLAQATDRARPRPGSQPFETEEFNAAISSLRNTLNAILYSNLKEAGLAAQPNVLALAANRFRAEAADIISALAGADGVIQLSEFRNPSPEFQSKIASIVGPENLGAAMNFSIAAVLRETRDTNPAELGRVLSDAYLARARSLLARAEDPTFAAEASKLADDFIAHATDLTGNKFISLEQARALLDPASELGAVLGQIDAVANGKIARFTAKLEGDKAETWIKGRADSQAADASEAAKLAIRNPHGYSLANNMDLLSIGLGVAAPLLGIGMLSSWLEKGNEVFNHGTFLGSGALLAYTAHRFGGDKPDALSRQLFGREPVPDPKSQAMKERIEQRIDQSPQLVAYLSIIDSDALSGESPLDIRAGKTEFTPTEWTSLVDKRIAAERKKSKPDAALIAQMESARVLGGLPQKDQKELYFLAAMAQRADMNIARYLKRQGHTPDSQIV